MSLVDELPSEAPTAWRTTHTRAQVCFCLKVQGGCQPPSERYIMAAGGKKPFSSAILGK
jgi:hypothetical protein